MIRDVFQELKSLKLSLVGAIKKEIATEGKKLLSEISVWVKDLEILDRNISILLHHDAITSTSP